MNYRYIKILHSNPQPSAARITVYLSFSTPETQLHVRGIAVNMLILKAFLLLGDVETIVTVYVCVKETRADGANTHTHTTNHSGAIRIPGK